MIGLLKSMKMIEKQYIDIFNQYRSNIDGKSVSILNQQRGRALEAFEALGFPNKKHEDYSYMDISAEFVLDYGLNINRVPVKGNPYFAFKCNASNLYTDLFYNLNDLPNKQFLPGMNFPKNVYVGSLNDFAETHRDICEKYYGQIADVNKSGIVAFNTMFAQDGFVIYVPKNTIVEKPIQLINILKSDHDYLVNRRVLIIVEENAQVKLLACDHTVDNQNYLVTQVNEIYAEKNSIIDFYDLEENSAKVTRLTSTHIQQAESSNVLFNNMTLTGGKTRNDYYVALQGEHSEAYVCGMVIGDEQQYVENFVFLDHLVPNCTSTQRFKYVLQEESTGAFCGRIRVEQDAQKTLAYQSNNNLCTSPMARMYSKPQLEIYADDVKCSHGLTTGQIDEDALFYLKARGIAEEDARLMLMQAFVAGVLDHVRIDVLKVRLEELISKRFKGEKTKCGSCEFCK